MIGRLHNKVALITGGTSGIGRATVELFAAEGANVVFTGRSQDAGDAIAEQVGFGVRFVRSDVTREDDVSDAIQFAVDTFGRLDILFNNAGGPAPGEMDTVSVEQFHYAMDLLLGSVVFGIKHAAPHMRSQKFGRIINNSSVAAGRAGYGGYLYSAAKAAVNQISRSAGMALGRHGVTVNCISPGGVATPIFFGGSQAARGLHPEEADAKTQRLTQRLSRATPLGRAGLPDDVAAAALFLACEGGYVNCHDLVVDAGMSIGGKSNYGDDAE